MNTKYVAIEVEETWLSFTSSGRMSSTAKYISSIIDCPEVPVWIAYGFM